MNSSHALRLTCLAGLAALISQPAVANDVRVIDEQVFAMLSEARTVRWAVADAPISESDRRRLLRETDDAYDELIDLQRSLFRGRSRDHLCGEVEDVREALCDLREDLGQRQYRVSYGGRSCGTGVADPLAGVRLAVDNLHAAADGLHGLVVGVVPQGPIGSDNFYGSPALPPANGGSVQPLPPSLPSLPPATFEPSLYAPSTGVSYPPHRRTTPYGAPYPRSYDRYDDRPTIEIRSPRDTIRVRSTDRRTSQSRRSESVGDGLRTLGWVLSQIDR